MSTRFPRASKKQPRTSNFNIPFRSMTTRPHVPGMECDQPSRKRAKTQPPVGSPNESLHGSGQLALTPGAQKSIERLGLGHRQMEKLLQAMVQCCITDVDRWIDALPDRHCEAERLGKLAAGQQQSVDHLLTQLECTLGSDARLDEVCEVFEKATAVKRETQKLLEGFLESMRSDDKRASARPKLEAFVQAHDYEVIELGEHDIEQWLMNQSGSTNDITEYDELLSDYLRFCRRNRYSY